MTVRERNIRLFVDYVLLNACSMNTSGLYQGKAGVAWALFYVGHTLNDDYIEEQGLSLLQESLLSKTEDISLEYGWSGIGYVLIDLMKNQLLDVDFTEIFGKLGESVLQKLSQEEKIRRYTVRVVYFLDALCSIGWRAKEAKQIIQQIVRTEETSLEKLLDSWSNKAKFSDKVKILQRIEDYFQLVTQCPHIIHTERIFQKYLSIYQKGTMISSYKIGHFISQKGNLYMKAGKDNLMSASLQKTFSLQDKIDKALFCNQWKEIEDIIENPTPQLLERNLSILMAQGKGFAEYETGLARLLIFVTRITPHLNFYYV